MASHATHRSQAKSLLKRGLITQKQHDRMLSKIDALAPPPGQPGDPQMTNAMTPANAAQVPVTASVPGDPNVEGDPTKPQQPPAA